MPCKDCGRGVWQCSEDENPCGMQMVRSAKDEPPDAVDVEETWFTIYVKKQGQRVQQQIFLGKGTPNPSSGWSLAGELGFRFEVHEDQTSGEPFIRATVIED